MTATSMIEYSCEPWAALPASGDAADLLDAVLDALEADTRALGPVCGYDYATERVSAIFQVELAPGVASLNSAEALAAEIFAAALRDAGAAPVDQGVAAVLGSDPEALP